MYQFKEITLKSNNHERKRLVIEFTDPTYDIVAAFLMSDAAMLQFEIVDHIEDVLTGKTETIETSGNRFSLIIQKEETMLEDLFTDLYDDFPTYERLVMPTETLLKLIHAWKEETEKFTNK